MKTLDSADSSSHKLALLIATCRALRGSQFSTRYVAARAWLIRKLATGRKRGRGSLIACALGLVWLTVVTPAADATTKDEPAEPEKTFRGHAGSVSDVAFHPDGKLLATASFDGTIKLWVISDDQPIATLSGHKGKVQSVEFRRDGLAVLTAGDDKTVRVWGLKFGEGTDTSVTVAEPQSFEGHKGRVHDAGYSPDGKLIASVGQDKSLQFWDTDSGKSIQSVEADTGTVYCLAFSPDGKQLATGAYSGLVKLWDTASRSETRKLEGHVDGVVGLVYSPDGAVVYSGGFDKTVRRWNVADGKQLAVYRHPGWVQGIALAGSEKRLLTADYSGRLIEWNTESGEAVARHRAPRAEPTRPPVILNLAVSADGSFALTANEADSAFLIRLQKP